MHTANKKTIALLICLIATTLLTGCTNWKKKYNALDVEHQNALGRLERELAEKQQIADQYSDSQMTIEQLQKKIHENQLSIYASNNIAGDPLYGYPKYLKVEYILNGEKKES